MRMMALALAASLIGTAALAETVVVKEGPATSSTTVVREAPPTVVEKRTVETTGSVGCETKSVTKTNEFGDTTKKTKTEC